MKTILFIDTREDELWRSFVKYDFLLDEFVSNGEFAVCLWNQDGMSVQEAIPDIEKELGEESEWQAVIVTDLRQPDAELRADDHFDNPFDFSDSYARTSVDEFEESAHALIRLTQMLGGLPESVHIEWPDKYSENVYLINGFGVDYSSPEGFYDVIERYRLGLPKPQRIVCISPRDVDEAFFDMRRIELKDKEVESNLDFWQRNNYAPTTRFVVFDHEAPSVEIERVDAEEFSDVEISVVEEKDSAPARRSRWFYFWVGVLSFVTTPLEQTPVNAFTVHSMRVNVDENELQRLISKKRAEWTIAVNAIDDQCDMENARLHPSEFVEAQPHNFPTTIPVQFDLVEQSRLMVDGGELGFFKDEPQSDVSLWRAQRTRSQHEFGELLRAPRRALRNAAIRFKSEKLPSKTELEYCVLNEHEQDKLRDKLRDADYELASTAGYSSFDTDIHEESLKKCSDKVVSEIKTRPSKKESYIALGVSLIAVLLGMLPFCFGLMGGWGFSIPAIIITIIVMLAMLAVWLLSMSQLRKKVVAAFNGYNQVMTNILSSMKEEAKRMEKRISSYATFKKEWTVLERQSNLDIPTSMINSLGFKRAKLQERIDELDAIARDCDFELEAEVVDASYDWETLSRDIDSDSFFELGGAVLRSKDSLLASNEVADSVFVPPYLFVDSIVIERLKVR